jgi:hypothetical protein
MSYLSFQSVIGTITFKGNLPNESSLTITAGRVFLISLLSLSLFPEFFDSFFETHLSELPVVLYRKTEYSVDIAPEFNTHLSAQNQALICVLILIFTFQPACLFLAFYWSAYLSV